MKGIYCGCLLLFIQFFYAINANSQDFIGLSEEIIKQEMNVKYRTFKLNTSNVNQLYNYLKYEDPVSEITILYFMSKDNKCTLVRKMYDYSNINDVLQELNEKYITIGKNLWEFQNAEKRYSVILIEDEWFFTVSIKQID